jgi:hypothetical protein
LATKREAQSFGGVREENKHIGISPKIADVFSPDYSFKTLGAEKQARIRILTCFLDE